MAYVKGLRKAILYRLKRNLCLEVNGRLATSRIVTLYTLFLHFWVFVTGNCSMLFSSKSTSTSTSTTRLSCDRIGISQSLVNLPMCHSVSVDCRWGEWTEFGEGCSSDCTYSGGHRVFMSVVAQHAQNGGADCVAIPPAYIQFGARFKKEECNRNCCPGTCRLG